MVLKPMPLKKHIKIKLSKSKYSSGEQSFPKFFSIKFKFKDLKSTIMPNWTMIGALLLPNAGGWASALTMAKQVKVKTGTAWYDTVKKPKWNPPNWVFGPAWTALYTSMGYASYMVYTDCGGFTDKAALPLAIYGGHLILNWSWTPVFFKFHKIDWALVNMLALDAAAVATTVSFYQVNPNTAYLMAPYLAWLTFASCLNFKIWQLNCKGKVDSIKEKEKIDQ